ncbi:MAG: AAA family ATPase [Oscillospiraceae bacterium]|jgi:hypothetical protein|nr:AAA family ATPase [Oscillospiraceae bacterium]
MKANLKLLTLEEIQAEAVQWLWEPYIALGKITLVQGDGGIGKSTMARAIAAAVTRGEEVGGTGVYAPPASVIYQSAEDGYADVVKPQLMKLGADCSRVRVIDESERGLTLSDERIEEAIVKAGARLFILDPLQAYLGGSDFHSVNGIRPLMKSLSAVAERTGCAVVIIGHLNKKGGQAQYRGLGSIDIYAAARSVLTVGKLPLDDSMRAIIHSKSNLAPLGAPQAFGLDQNGDFCWLGDCEITLDEMLSGKPKAENQFSKAVKLLELALAVQPVAAVEIMRRAEEQGISPKTLNRAKSALGVQSIRKNGQWFWVLPI